MPYPPPASAGFETRIAFVVELAARLHRYGTTAHRIEGAVTAVAARLGLDCEAWSNPTGLILSFGDPGRDGGSGGGTGSRDTVRVIRLAPGENDLYKLCEADRIAEAVMAGEMGLSEGHAELRALDQEPGWRGKTLQVFAFGLASAGVAGLLRLPWLDIATAGLTGLLIGLLDLAIRNRPRLKMAGDALAAILAGTIALSVAAFVAPLNLNTVIIASLIVLLPGLTLTNAMNELSSQSLVAGTTRFAGAVMTILKLTVGTMIALTLAQLIGLHPQVAASRPQADWVEWISLALAAYAFAVLFHAHRRDYPVVMLAAAAGYLISRFAGGAWGSPVGIFLSALALTAAGNAYARWMNRPGAVVRVPGIIMLVPGSASLRGVMTLIQQQDVDAYQSAVLGVLMILLALIAGLLFGNLLIPTRRNL